MRTTNAALLFHPLFLASLFCLAVNDGFLKAAWPSVFTGKLSDVCGLVVLPLFVRSLLPTVSPHKIGIGCAAFFCWWKSPLSQPAIDFFQTAFLLPVNRVVDYTDLLALPATWVGVRLSPPPQPVLRGLKRIARAAIVLLTTSALCATSLPYRGLYAGPPNHHFYFIETFTVHRPADSVLQSLQNRQIALRRDSTAFWPVRGYQGLFYKVPAASDTAIFRQYPTDTTFYVLQRFPPFYLIPFYETKDATLRNIRFRLASNKKGNKTKVEVESFEDHNATTRYLDKETRHFYKRLIADLFEAGKR